MHELRPGHAQNTGEFPDTLRREHLHFCVHILTQSSDDKCETSALRKFHSLYPGWAFEAPIVPRWGLLDPSSLHKTPWNWLGAGSMEGLAWRQGSQRVRNRLCWESMASESLFLQGSLFSGGPSDMIPEALLASVSAEGKGDRGSWLFSRELNIQMLVLRFLFSAFLGLNLCPSPLPSYSQCDPDPVEGFVKKKKKKKKKDI